MAFDCVKSNPIAFATVALALAIGATTVISLQWVYKGRIPSTMAGLLGSGGPLGAVGGLTDTVGGVAGSDGPLSTVGGLTDGLPLGDLGGGLLGGSEGLNLLGIAGVGSDDKAVLDINPAEKKEVKAQKAELAKKRKQAREQQ